MLTHKDLGIWKLGIELVEGVYKITAKFLKEEAYGLTSQMRRAVTSIPSNIYVSLGSLAEIDTQIFIAERLGYINDHQLTELIEKLRRKLLNFIKYIRTTK